MNKCKVCNDTKCDYRRSAFGDPPEYWEACWVDGGEDAPTLLPSAVMALDFHDSPHVCSVELWDYSDAAHPIEVDINSFTQGSREEAEQAREDAWRDAVMRGKYKVEDIV